MRKQVFVVYIKVQSENFPEGVTTVSKNTASLRVKVQTRDLPNTEQKCYPLKFVQ
jgi:hypothetical protein